MTAAERRAVTRLLVQVALIHGTDADGPPEHDRHCQALSVLEGPSVTRQWPCDCGATALRREQRTVEALLRRKPRR